MYVIETCDEEGRTTPLLICDSEKYANKWIATRVRLQKFFLLKHKMYRYKSYTEHYNNARLTIEKYDKEVRRISAGVALHCELHSLERPLSYDEYLKKIEASEKKYHYDYFDIGSCDFYCYEIKYIRK